ncbi:MAG: hypothetical protein F7B17_07000 [Desulfurococcales archaeon]|nr:hypothetical protein [Desulfurococcales archaeon]
MNIVEATPHDAHYPGAIARSLSPRIMLLVVLLVLVSILFIALLTLYSGGGGPPA